jgi:hypothetical protein
VSVGGFPSMEGYSQIAAKTGVRGLWWSEHDFSFDQDAEWVQTFNPPLLLGVGGQPSLNISPMTRRPPDAAVRISPPLHALPEVTLRYERGPLAGGKVVNLYFDLSWRYYGTSQKRDRLHLQFTGSTGAATVTEPGRVTRRLFIPRTTSGPRTVKLPIDLSTYPLSGDNLVGRLRFVPSGTWIKLYEVRFRCRAGTRSQVLAARRQIAASNGSRYETTEFVGVEQEGNTPSNPLSVQQVALKGPGHINAFLPVDADIQDHGLHPSEYSAYVHERGGVTSLNHPFGVGDQAPESRPDEVRQVTEYLLANDVFGADLLEVGYLTGRNTVNFDGHMRLWDNLLANLNHLGQGNPDSRRLIGGVGVSDSHLITPHGPSRPFCTWFLSGTGVEPTRVEAVELLRSGRMFFGAYKTKTGSYKSFPVDGYFDFTIGGLIMGQSGEVNTAESEVPLTVFLPAGQAPPNNVLRLVELPVIPEDGLPDFDVVATTRELPDLEDVVTVDAPKIFRLELWSTAGEPIALTNPILAMPQSAGLQGGEEVTPTPSATPTETTTETPTPDPTATAEETASGDGEER